MGNVCHSEIDTLSSGKRSVRKKIQTQEVETKTYRRESEEEYQSPQDFWERDCNHPFLGL